MKITSVETYLDKYVLLLVQNSSDLPPFLELYQPNKFLSLCYKILRQLKQ